MLISKQVSVYIFVSDQLGLKSKIKFLKRKVLMFLGLNILMSYFLHERCKFHISFIGSIVLDQLNWGQNQNYKSSNTPFQISFTQLLHLCCLAFNVSFQFFYIIHNIFQELFSITFQISFPNFHSKYFKDEWNPNGPE